MRVKVYLPSFGDRTVLDERNTLALPEGATLGDGLRKLRIPVLLRRLPIVVVNHKRAAPSQVLCEGDTIAFVGYHVGG